MDIKARVLSVITLSILQSATMIMPENAWAESQFIDPLDGQLDMGEYLAENAYGFLPVPSVITDPALGTGLVLMGMFLHETPEQQQKRQQFAMQSANGGAQLLTPGISVAGVGATDNGTKFGFAAHRQTWGQDSVRYLAGGAYSDMNMSFYSQQNLANSLSLDMNMQGFAVLQKLQYRLPDSYFFVGISQRYVDLSLSLCYPFTALPPEISDRIGDIANTTPRTSALGIILEYDNLDNFFMPSRGYDYVFEYYWFNDAFGSDYNYESLNAEGLNFWPLAEQLTLGVRLQYQAVSSDTRLPVFAYPFIDLRGIARNRYQGENVGTGEVELMWNITPRWMLLSFVGTGLVGSSHSQMWDADAQTAYGAGFRYSIARRYGLHIGIDVAKGPEDTAWYINMGTGF